MLIEEQDNSMYLTTVFQIPASRTSAIFTSITEEIISKCCNADTFILFNDGRITIIGCKNCGREVMRGCLNPKNSSQSIKYLQ